MSGTSPSASRRTVLRGAAVVPVAAGLGLAACSPGDSAQPATPTAPVDVGAEGEVGKGGAVLYPDHNVVVSRSADGAVTAYGSVCTHAGCAISDLEGTKLVCTCHGSEFDALTGEVLQGPATVALPELPVKTENGRLVVGPQA
ncbi:Rieske 2Fe-2S domain-containing protein [Streptomyces sp. NPDC056716]|uniref:Rieske (2Fe-2S) protein n=1 Tax=unclassified Streptomyces TaxID=2593676 RepID=UPI0036A207CF